MQSLQGTKQVRQLLIDCDISNDDIFRIYNDKIKKGRRYKIWLCVFDQVSTGRQPISSQGLTSLKQALQDHNAQDVFISQDKIEFKIIQ